MNVFAELEPVWVCEKGHVDDFHLVDPNPDDLCSRCGGKCEPFTVEKLAREYIERLRVNVGLLAENTQLKKKLGEGGDAHDSRKPGHHVAEGDSVQCDGVALAQLPCVDCGRFIGSKGHVSVEHRELGGGIESVEGLCPDCLRADQQKNPERYGLQPRDRAIVLKGSLGEFFYTQQQSSGGQEGGVEEGADKDERWSEAEQERHEAAAEIHADWEREAEEDG